MAAVTRFGLEGYGVRRVGSFADKTPGDTGGPHPVGIITRFGLEGYGVRRAGAFDGKTASTDDTGATTDWLVRARRRGCR